ncbi:MAG: ZIP family metal transporter [Candidatus Pacearchaeota archaeon]
METIYWIILMTLINGLLAFCGAFSFFLSKKSLNKMLIIMVAFATGALIGGALFHLIPESYKELKLIKTVILIISGFAIFYSIEKVLHWHHCHKNEKCEKHPYTYLMLYGDAIHNFVDGLIIASSFIISIPLGILTSFLIISHELPQEIGNFGVLVYGGFSKVKAIFYNFFAQTTSILGGILGFYFIGIKDIALFILPIAAGGFLYIAFMDLFPEIFNKNNKDKIIFNIIALILGILLLISAKIFIG